MKMEIDNLRLLDRTLTEAINALPEGLREFIYELEARADPSGDVRELVLRREQVKHLEKVVIDGVMLRQPAPICIVKSWVEMVREFHTKYGVYIAPHLEEEGHELEDAMMADPANITEVADAIADLIYVLIGTALTYGIPLDDVFAEVHRSNMTKDGSRREDGKILKGVSFEPPRIKEILDRHAARTSGEASVEPSEKDV